MEVECRADGLVPMQFAIFPVHVSKVLRLPRKSDARSYEVLHQSRKIILANLKIWCSKNATLLRKSAPWPPHISDEYVSCIAPATRNASLQILLTCPTPAIVLGNARNLHVLLTFGKVRNPSRLSRKTASEPSKMVRACGVFNILTWKCASRRNDVHLNFQKCFENGVLCTCWLRNVLCATTACTFWTSQLRKVVQDRQFLTLLTSKCASRHNGVQFFISHLARWLGTRRFSEPTFGPSGATNHAKNAVSRDLLFYLFAHLYLLSSDSFSSLIFSSPTLPTSAFPSVHIVGSLAPKLPSNMDKAW